MNIHAKADMNIHAEPCPKYIQQKSAYMNFI
jgi:hypothetical protein